MIIIAVVAALTGGNSSEAPFNYSEGIDENGFWEGIKALEHVEMFDYAALPIPNDVHTITDDELRTEIDKVMANYFKPVMDRAVADGDKVNIDYVGMVDGVEFEKGSTNGDGQDVTAGGTGFIDDFLTQIIGHIPGEMFNVEVTFPEEYPQNPDLAGKDAVFVTTINYITGDEPQELTDDFVAEQFSANGWETVDEFKDAKRVELKENAIKEYIQNYLRNDVAVSAIRDSLVKYQENSMVDIYQMYADMYGVGLDEFLQTNVGVSNKKELIETNSDDILKNASYTIAVQAVAEDAGISVSDEDLDNYWPDYSSNSEQYGMPWIKQYVLNLKVLDLLYGNIVLE
jgi:trigger factor